ncbi:general secretion pathway protein GspB [Pseudomonas sp.]|uniref:general secretion pathway protein GspB n=1 Tax=Pseudomonas sp. TaxID=306 RepID=UPI00273720C8|nr:general secretion pathway protein GspB [Pseudomonas sp.]MDP3813851.1 general secretion pathway protein GspB [Pseudomonas sp.]
MSYILNALKQSESQRNLGDVPHIDTAQEPSSPYRPGRRSSWRWAVLGVSLILLLGLGGLWLANRPAPPSAAAPLATPLAMPAEAPLALPAESPSAEPQAPGLAQLQNMAGTRIQLDDQPPPSAQPATAPITLELPVNSGRVAAPSVAAVERERPQAPPIPSRRDAEPDQDIPSGVSHWKMLPAAAQTELRELGINAHVYSSDSSARFIRAKGRSLREGDRLSAALQLQQITRAGIIFSYQDGRYWMRLN